MKKTGILVALALVGAAILVGGIYVSRNLATSEAATTENARNNTPQASQIATDAIVLNVRTPEEFSASHAKQAVNLPLQSLEAAETPNADKNQKIYLYCRSGNRSAQAATILKQAGYTDVIDLGGMADAEAAGLEFTNI